MTSSRTTHTADDLQPRQLSLFEPSALPDRFRLDDATRRRGMRHIARIRAQLEARYPAGPVDPPSGTDRQTPVGSRVTGDRRAA